MRFCPPGVSAARIAGCFSAGFIIGVAAAPATTQTRPSNLIRVWKVGSPFTGERPDGNLPFPLVRQAQKFGHEINVETFPAAGFTERLRQAVEAHAEPEILAITNYGVIWGATTQTGRVDGVVADHKIFASLAMVNESFGGLLGDGWLFVINTAANYEAVKSLALRPAMCPGQPAGPQSPELQSANQAALAATRAYLSCDSPSLLATSDESKLGNRCYLPGYELKLGTLEACKVSGNQNLAFVLLAGTFTAQAVQPTAVVRPRAGPLPVSYLGRQTVLAILRKSEAGWRLLAISDDPTDTDTATSQRTARVASMLEHTGGALTPVWPAQVMIPDGALIQPVPGQRFGDFTWNRSPSSDIVCQVPEFLVMDSQLPRQRTRLFFLFDGETKLSAGFLWGARGIWRVWSIDRQGNIAFSDQRAYRTH